jgi:tRNA pseudouridine55 synthase
MMRNAILRWTDGVVLLDKPRGISSQKAVTLVKHACGADKAGHTGTLDPLATGLLAVCLGEATKYSQDLFNSDKSYIATLLFGVKTDTGDSEGKIILRAQEPTEQFKESFTDQLQHVVPRFMGQIAQVPPMYSAIKKDGRPLYAYAREGEMFDLEARQIQITELEVLSCAWPVAVIKVSCSKGTYIRSLISDIGDALGVGAHMTELRRTRIGHLKLADAQTFDEVKSDLKMMQVDSLITHVPAIVLEHHTALRLKMGQRIGVRDVLAQKDDTILQSPLLRIYHLQHSTEQFMGLVEQKNGVLHPKRLLATDRLEHILEQPVLAPHFSIDTSIKHHLHNSQF